MICDRVGATSPDLPERPDQSLKQGRSGVEFSETYAEMGFRSHVHGALNIDTKPLIDRKLLRFMGDAAAYSYLAMREAVADSGLGEESISNHEA